MFYTKNVKSRKNSKESYLKGSKYAFKSLFYFDRFIIMVKYFNIN